MLERRDLRNLPRDNLHGRSPRRIERHQHRLAHSLLNRFAIENTILLPILDSHG